METVNFSDVIKSIFPMDISNYIINIDKDYYKLYITHIGMLNAYNFNFNSINFDIIIYRLSEYIKLLTIKNDVINQKLENFNINNLIIDDITIFNSLDIIKHLEYKNLNFKLLPLSKILNISNQDIIIYLINNKLYDFSNRDKYEIIKYCSISTFKFFISYLDLDVYANYNGNSFYKFIDDNNIYSKVEILYKDYNLLINDKDISEVSPFISNHILSIYNIDDIKRFNQQSLYKILIDNVNKYITDKNTNLQVKYGKVIESLNSINIEFLIKILKCKDLYCINKYGKEKYTIIDFKEIIDKINMDLTNIIDILKTKLKLKQLLKFYDLYYAYYNQDIVNYIEVLFNCKNIEEFEQLKNTIYNDI